MNILNIRIKNVLIKTNTHDKLKTSYWEKKIVLIGFLHVQNQLPWYCFFVKKYKMLEKFSLPPYRLNILTFNTLLYI